MIGLKKIYEEQCNAIIYENFDGVSLRDMYPCSIIEASIEDLLQKSEHSTSFDGLRDIPLDFENSCTSFSVRDLGSPQKLGFEELVSVFGQVAEALDHLHRCKISHHNICPENIIVKRIPGKEFPLVQLANFSLASSFDKFKVASERQKLNYPYISPGIFK